MSAWPRKIGPYRRREWRAGSRQGVGRTLQKAASERHRSGWPGWGGALERGGYRSQLSDKRASSEEWREERREGCVVSAQEKRMQTGRDGKTLHLVAVPDEELRGGPGGARPSLGTGQRGGQDRTQAGAKRGQNTVGSGLGLRRRKAAERTGRMAEGRAS